VQQAFAVRLGYVEFAGGDEQQEGAVLDVELADVEVVRCA
jgi:hypothetical protein